jgi:hypothetical protein
MINEQLFCQLCGYTEQLHLDARELFLGKGSFAGTIKEERVRLILEQYPGICKQFLISPDPINLQEWAKENTEPFYFKEESIIFNCKVGLHSLETIFKVPYENNDSYAAVRHCSYCGAVVVDLDVDNRTQPGKVVKMKLPTIATRILKK